MAAVIVAKRRANHQQASATAQAQSQLQAQSAQHPSCARLRHEDDDDDDIDLNFELHGELDDSEEEVWDCLLGEVFDFCGVTVLFIGDGHNSVVRHSSRNAVAARQLDQNEQDHDLEGGEAHNGTQHTAEIDASLNPNSKTQQSQSQPHHMQPSFLSEFVRSPHEIRVKQADGYISESREYFFERSARLFETIYKFYATGTLHRPLDVCLQEFCDELGFWGIPDQKLAECCAPKILEKEFDEVEEDPFKVSETRTKQFVEVDEDGNITEVTKTKIVWEPHPVFEQIEFVCIVWFTFEYVFRFTIAPHKRTFMRGALNIVDLLAIIPFYLELGLDIIGIDTEKLEDLKGALLVVRILRVLRVVRILKLGRYSAGMRTFALTLRSSAKQLAMMAMVFATACIFFATMVYFMEKDEPGTPFTSIPAGLWWCIVTMTTVGYGDIVPITTVGKLIGSAAIMCGVLVLALPITIIVDNFMKVSGK